MKYVVIVFSYDLHAIKMGRDEKPCYFKDFK
jgi:hypothetical protein